MAEIRGPGEVTELLGRWSSGEEGAGERLLAVVYGELRGLAAAALRRERPGHTLQPTELVHEAFLKLVATPVASFEEPTRKLIRSPDLHPCYFRDSLLSPGHPGDNRVHAPRRPRAAVGKLRIFSHLRPATGAGRWLARDVL